MSDNYKKCGPPNTDPLYDEGDCSNGSGSDTNDGNNDKSCKPLPNVGDSCPDTGHCTVWDLTETNDACLIDRYISESIQIGGAVVNVHKLMGIHEQGLLQDVTGNGTPITNGDHPNFPAIQAFDKFVTEWRSLQTGNDVLSKAYIGYDFGEIKLENGRDRYGIETFVKKSISTIRIKQGCKSENRVSSIRLERSDNGEKWYGVGIVNVEDCDGLLTLNFNSSVPSRFWRIRPTNFNGGENDSWVIQALQFSEYEQTNIKNIQDKILLENRDRDYNDNPIRLKGAYQPVESVSFMDKMGFTGMFNGEQLFLELSFSSILQNLGRPMVIGDIIQLPSETQYTPSLKPVLKYYEITDVTWASNGFTPSWKPTIQRIIAEPPIASQETQDLFGKLTEDYDDLNTSDVNDGMFDKKYQDISNIDQTINAEQNTAVPERGVDHESLQTLSDDVYDWAEEYEGLDVAKIDNIKHPYFGTDGMPPNGQDYTEGDEFPESPSNGDYHRLTYVEIGEDIPPRLHRYSTIKKRWVYLETDMRSAMKTNALQDEFIDEDKSSKTRPDEINKDLDDTQS